MIPYNIFMFWKGKLTIVADSCMKKIKEENPEFTVTVFNDTIEDHENLKDLSVQWLSDWVRICAIEKYGGVWLDATIIPVVPIDKCFDMESDELQGFSAPFAEDCLENWAFAAPPKHPLIVAWKREFKEAIAMGFKTYKNKLPDFLKKHSIYRWLPYLTMHACYLVVSNNLRKSAILKPSCNGPFAYLCETNFKTRQSVTNLLTHRHIEQNLPPFFKLRGLEARELEKRLYQIEDGSVIDTYLSVSRKRQKNGNVPIFIFILVMVVVICITIFKKVCKDSLGLEYRK